MSRTIRRGVIRGALVGLTFVRAKDMQRRQRAERRAAKALGLPHIFTVQRTIEFWEGRA